MANPTITELDFFAIKDQLKTYLKTQQKFKDYDFDGSNMSVLLDIMAYNAYQTNFYTNMALSEAFLDSAILPQSVMSHAKSLNYIPRSAKSAQAVVNIAIVSANNESSFIIPAGSRFTSRTSVGDSYTFYTSTGHIALREANSNRYVANCVPIFEGTQVTERFSISDTFDGFYIQNSSVDISSLKLVNNTTGEEYFYRTDIFGTTSSDTVFYIEADKESYRIVFGDDTYGKKPNQADVFTLTYRTSNGDVANGMNKFNSVQFPNAVVTVLTPAFGGAQKESLESIKFYAPRSIQVQERAVTRRDYEILLKQRFPQILDVSAYDGSDLLPPQHGRVAISVNVDGGLSTADKNSFLAYLSDKTPIAIKPVFIDADFMYLKMSVSVRVNNSIRTKSDGEIKQLIIDKISEFNNSELGKFGDVLYENNLNNTLVSSDRSIITVAVTSLPYYEYTPLLNISDSPTFKFETQLIKPYPFNSTSGFSNYKPAIRAETFVYDTVSAMFMDDGVGKIQIVSADASNIQILNNNIGTIDYNTGILNLSGFRVNSYEGSAIKIYANMLDEIITAPKNRVLTIKPEDITVNIIAG